MWGNVHPHHPGAWPADAALNGSGSAAGNWLTTKPFAVPAGSTLHVNEPCCSTASDFAVAEIIVWQAQLTLAEILAAEAHLLAVLANGNGLRHGGYMKALVGACDDPRAPIDTDHYAAPSPLLFGAVVLAIHLTIGL